MSEHVPVKNNRKIRKGRYILRGSETIKEEFSIKVSNRYERLADELEEEGVDNNITIT